MKVLWCQQEKIAIAIFEFVLVDAMSTAAIDDIHQFKEVVLMGWFKTLVCFFINDLKRLVKVLGIHTRKSTE